MIFKTPIPFEEALQSRQVKALLPTTLSSGELMEIAPDLRERSMFSARTVNAEHLQRISDKIDTILNPVSEDGRTVGLDWATARLELKQGLRSDGYLPDPDQFGTLKDLSSDVRLNTIIKTNVEMAQGYGQFAQGQDEAVLDQWPAQELFRAEGRKVPRDWESIWREHGGESFGGRMIALKDDPIWTEISAFGLPYPPFDFGSGMWVRDIDRTEAESLGLLNADQRVEPQSRGFNADLQMTPAVRDEALMSALMQDVGDKYSLTDGVLTRN